MILNSISLESRQLTFSNSFKSWLVLMLVASRTDCTLKYLLIILKIPFDWAVIIWTVFSIFCFQFSLPIFWNIVVSQGEQLSALNSVGFWWREWRLIIKCICILCVPIIRCCLNMLSTVGVFGCTSIVVTYQAFTFLSNPSCLPVRYVSPTLGR